MSVPEPDLTIRAATPDDAAGIVAILNPIIEARVYTAMDTPLTVESLLAYMQGLAARSVYHVAAERRSGRIVGSQDLTPFSPYPGSFDHVATMGTFVDLAHHRRGIAARLFEATYEAARKLGYEKIFTFVRADNEAGLRAYRGQGFGVVGTAARHCRIDGRYIDEVMIERFL